MKNLHVEKKDLRNFMAWDEAAAAVSVAAHEMMIIVVDSILHTIFLPNFLTSLPGREM